MTFSQNLDKMILRYMGVALCCCDRRMSQEFLDHSNVCAVAQQESCYSVSQHVRGDMPFDTCVFPKLRNDIRNALSRQPCTGSVQKQSLTARSNTRTQLEMLLLYEAALLIH